MPLPVTHALVPLAGAMAISRRPFNWRLILVAGAAAMAPDVDGLTHHFLGVGASSIYGHRGLAHSLFIAVAAGATLASFHRFMQIAYWRAALVIAAAVASHGLLDMMTDGGRGVAFWWPMSSARYFFGPIHSIAVSRHHFLAVGLLRLASEIRQVVVPMMLCAVLVRFAARDRLRRLAAD
jgi:inner membrane protein